MAVKLTQPKQPGFLQNLLAGLVSPIRKTLGSGVEAGFNIGNKLGMGNSDQLGIRNPFLDPKEVRTIRNQPITQSAKNLAGIGAYTVPFPAAGGFKAAFLSGAASGALSSLSQDETSLEDVIKSGLFGGTTAGVLNKLLNVKSGTSKLGENLEAAGTTARRKVLNPQTSTAPYAASEEKAALALQEKLGLKGSARSQMGQIDKLYNTWNDEISSIIDSGSNRADNKGVVGGKIRSFVEQEGKNFIPGDASYEKILNRELTKFDRSVAGDAVTARDIFNFKKQIASNYKNAFKKASGESASSLTAPESVALDIWQSLDNLLVELEPGVKDLTLKQSQLYDIAPGIIKKAKETAQIPLIGGRVGTGPLQAVEDAAGRGLQGAGRALQGTAAGIPQTPEILRQILLRGGAAGAGGNMPGQTDSVPTPAQVSPLTNTSTGVAQPNTQQILKQILAAGVLEGKVSASDISALNTLGLLGTEDKPLTETQQARSDIRSLTDQALRALETGSVKTGPIAPKFENLKAVFNAGDESTLGFNALISSIRATIAKARAGTSFTANEEKLLNQYTPQVGDSDQQLRIKLQGLQQLFGQ